MKINYLRCYYTFQVKERVFFILGIIILNYNNWRVTIKCVESIVFNCQLKYRIFIVDNNSTNDSFDVLSKEYNDNYKVEIIKNEANLGYSAGNNVGIKQAINEGIKYCIITNNDVQFKGNTIENLYNCIKEKKDAVIVGPKIFGTDGNIQHSSKLSRIRKIDAYEIGRLFKPAKLDEANEKYPSIVYSVSGSCFMVDLDKFIQIKAFDEGTFLYNEENILGEQVSHSSYSVYFQPNAEIIHEHGATTGKINLFICTEYIKSYLYYWKKYRKANKVTIFCIYYTYVSKITLKSILSKELKNGRVVFLSESYKYLKELYNLDNS